jgi:tetratricopeptide (TPR) repeat protein
MYRFGLRLLHFGRRVEARAFLEAFEGAFPSREVYGNLGYLYLRQAMDLMPESVAYRYWLPLTMDVATRVDSLKPTRRGGTDAIPASAMDSLQSAAYYLDQAVNMDQDYAPAWVNLAITARFLGQVYLARHALTKARSLAPADVELAVLEEMIRAEGDLIDDRWPEVVGHLKQLSASGKSPLSIRFTLAQISSELGHHESAGELWAWLRERAGDLPEPYFRRVCATSDGIRPDCASRVSKEVPPPWPLPLPVGVDLYKNKTIKAMLKSESWSQRSFDFGTKEMRGNIYWKDGEVAVLDVDSYTDMVVLYSADLGSGNALREQLGTPIGVNRIQDGEIWTYRGGWAVVVRNGMVTEAWISRPPES